MYLIYYIGYIFCSYSLEHMTSDESTCWSEHLAPSSAEAMGPLLISIESWNHILIHIQAIVRNQYVYINMYIYMYICMIERPSGTILLLCSPPIFCLLIQLN